MKDLNTLGSEDPRKFFQRTQDEFRVHWYKIRSMTKIKKRMEYVTQLIRQSRHQTNKFQSLAITLLIWRCVDDRGDDFFFGRDTLKYERKTIRSFYYVLQQSGLIELEGIRYLKRQTQPETPPSDLIDVRLIQFLIFEQVRLSPELAYLGSCVIEWNRNWRQLIDRFKDYRLKMPNI